MRIYLPKYWRTHCKTVATFVQVSQICCHEILTNLQGYNFATLVRMLRDSRPTVLRKHGNNSGLSGEKIHLRNTCTNVMRHSHECLVTVVRVRMKFRYIQENVARCSHECLLTVVCVTRDYIFAKFGRNSLKYRINVHSLRLQRESCLFIIYLCRKLVTN